MAERLNVRTRSKVVIVGAGMVGSTFAFALTMSGLTEQIILIDSDRRRAEGEVMDLNHGLSFVPNTTIKAGDYEDCRDARVVVVTAGAPQMPGQSRLELVKTNSEIFDNIIPRIAALNESGVLLIVSNPVDVLTYRALKISGFPVNRVIGSGTTLDTSRLRYLLSDHCNVDPHNVHAYIVGEHGDSEVPVWSLANIGGLLIREFCPVCEGPCDQETLDGIFERVRTAAGEIIQRKKSTYYAIGLALVRIVRAILRDEKTLLPVSSLFQGMYGIEDVVMSMPSILNTHGVDRVLELELDNTELAGVRRSAEILKDVVASAGV